MGLAARAMLVLLAAVYVTAALHRLVNQDFYAATSLPFLPWPEALVRAIALLELALGLALLFQGARRGAALGLVGLVGAQLPGSVWMAVSDATGLGAWNWARIPVQAGFMGWTWLYSRARYGGRP